MSERDATREKRPVFSFNVEESLKKKKAQDLTIGNLVDGFVKSVQCHGVPRIYYAYGFAKKFMWAIIVSATIVMLAQNVVEVLKTYFSYRIDIFIAYKPQRQLAFPAVTICNINPIKMSAIPRETFSKLEGDYSAFGKNAINNNRGVIQEWLTNYSWTEKKRFGYQLEEFLLTCEFLREDCLGEWRWIDNPKYTNCYIFNAGYKNSPSRRNSTRSGTEFGLEMIINVNQSEYLGFLSDQAGARILIHDPSEFPFPEEYGLHVAPGFASSIGIKQTKIGRITTPKEICIDTSLNNSAINQFEVSYNWTKYSVLACEKSVIQSIIVQICKCYDPMLIQPSKHRACWKPEEVRCLESVRQNHSMNVDELPSRPGPNEMKCVEPCERIEYKTSYSIALWPSEPHVPYIQNELVTCLGHVPSKEELTTNILKVVVYYRDLNYEHIFEEPEYRLASLAADLGGALGLWFGASVISLFDIIEFIIDFVVLKCTSLTGNL